MSLVNDPEIIRIYDAAMALRKRYGKPRQILDESYCAVAQRWATHMMQKRFMGHGGGEEIVAWHSSNKVDATDCIPSWEGSPGHLNWLISNQPKCGFAIARAPVSAANLKPSGGGTYWAGEFTAGIGQPLPDDPPEPPVNPRPPKLTWWEIVKQFLGLYR